MGWSFWEVSAKAGDVSCVQSVDLMARVPKDYTPDPSPLRGSPSWLVIPRKRQSREGKAVLKSLESINLRLASCCPRAGCLLTHKETKAQRGSDSSDSQGSHLDLPFLCSHCHHLRSSDQGNSFLTSLQIVSLSLSWQLTAKAGLHCYHFATSCLEDWTRLHNPTLAPPLTRGKSKPRTWPDRCHTVCLLAPSLTSESLCTPAMPASMLFVKPPSTFLPQGLCTCRLLCLPPDTSLTNPEAFPDHRG